MQVFAAKTNPNQVDLNGTTLTVYHRTKSNDIANAICDIGFAAGGGAMYGKGIYSTYDLKSSLRNSNMQAYGGEVVKAEVDISGFVICDYDLAKQIYGQNYKLIDQIKALNLDRRANLDMGRIANWSEELEKGGWTSDIACPLSHKIVNSGARGIIFTGRNDGKVCVSFREINVTPLEHAWVDGRTYKNPQWDSCPARSKEELERLKKEDDAHKEFLDERWILIEDLRKADDGHSPISINRNKYRHVPQGIFEQVLSNFLYEDDSRIDRIDPQLKASLGDVLEQEFLIKKLKTSPTLYWDEWKKVDQSVRDKIGEQFVIDLWQDYLDKHPGRWEDVPEEMRYEEKIEDDGSVTKNPILDIRKETRHWLKAVQKNEKNWSYVPKDIVETIREVEPGIVPKNIETSEEELGQTDVFKIPYGSMSWVQNEIAKMNRKAAKLGLPPLRVDEIGDDRAMRMKEIRVIGNVPVLNGYELIARFTPVTDDKGKYFNDIENLSGDVIPPEFATMEPECQHCNVNRKRKKLYIVKETEKGEYWLVGSTCLGEFVKVPGEGPEKIANYAEKLNQMMVRFKDAQDQQEDEKTVRKDFKDNGVPVEFFLNKVMLLQNKFGFMGRRQARNSGDQATGDLAYMMCIDPVTDKKYGGDQPIDPGSVTTINEAMEWIGDIQPPPPGVENDFLWQLHAAVDVGHVIKRTSGIVSWLPTAYQRHLAKEGREDLVYEQLLGDIGEQIIFQGKVIDQQPIAFNIMQNDQKQKINESYYIAADSNRNKGVVWTDRTGSFNQAVDDTVTLKGTISGYSNIGNLQATALINVEVLDQQTYEQNIGQQDQKVQAWIDSKTNQAQTPTPQQPLGDQKKVYQAGDQIEEDFTIDRATRTRTGSFFYFIVDPYGTKMKTFMREQYNVGEKVRLQGTVNYEMFKGKRYLKLDYPKEVQQVQTPQPQPQIPAQPQQQMGVYPPSNAQPMTLQQPEDADAQANNWYRRMVMAWKNKFGKTK